MGVAVKNPCGSKLEVVVGNLIESIAMEENAIAHILNAENEKLFKIITLENVTVEELMAANLSVKQTIDAVIRLESVLQAKLSLIKTSFTNARTKL